MKAHRVVSAVALLVAGVVLIPGSLVGGQDKTQYHTGKLVRVEDATDILDNKHKTALLLLIQDGPEQYVAHYTVTWFGHTNKDLVAGAEVEFRVAGNSVYLKTADGKEAKAHLCTMSGEAARCGGTTFAPAFPAKPNSP